MNQEKQENLECQEDQEENKSFIKKAEALVKPQDVTTIGFFSDLNRTMPKKVQHAFMQGGKKKVPYMGFIVDPYCFFLCFKITNTSAAQEMLPDGYELADISVFKGDSKNPIIVAGVFTARTSAFMGMRLELYIIARNKKTGLISWIICDYETNTNSYDPKNGFSGFTCDPAVYTTTPFGELLVDIKNRKNNKEYSLSADLKKGVTRELDESLWIEGNLCVDYGGALKSDLSESFTLIFDQNMMKEAVEIPLEHVSIRANTHLSNIIDPLKPVKAVLFPYCQHFIIRQDLAPGDVKNQTELCKEMKAFLERTNFKTMSGDDIKKPLFASLCITFVANVCFLIILLLT